MKHVNVTKNKCTHYCGRDASYKENGINYSILGNPFWMSDESQRAKVIADFRVKLNADRIADNSVWKALVALPKDAILGCFCAPKACHCQVIIDAWNWHYKS